MPLGIRSLIKDQSLLEIQRGKKKEIRTLGAEIMPTNIVKMRPDLYMSPNGYLQNSPLETRMLFRRKGGFCWWLDQLDEL